MGEQKRKQHEAAKLAQRLKPAVARVSMALRKLAKAASSHLGADCYLHAQLGSLLLKDLGFEADPVVGYAAWRIGAGDGDVISHGPQTQGYLPVGANQGLAYHAWLQCYGFVIDFTTYQLERKAQQLDAADGGHTTVSWCPEFLLLPPTEIRRYEDVAAALHPGVAYYEARPELEPMLCSQFVLDAEHVLAARLLLANPDTQVIGPNDFPEFQSMNLRAPK